MIDNLESKSRVLLFQTWLKRKSELSRLNVVTHIFSFNTKYLVVINDMLYVEREFYHLRGESSFVLGSSSLLDGVTGSQNPVFLRVGRLALGI